MKALLDSTNLSAFIIAGLIVCAIVAVVLVLGLIRENRN